MPNTSDATVLDCRCPEGYTCTEVDTNLAVNYPGMHTIMLSMLSMFQCVTLSSWSYMQVRFSCFYSAGQSCSFGEPAHA